MVCFRWCLGLEERTGLEEQALAIDVEEGAYPLEDEEFHEDPAATD